MGSDFHERTLEITHEALHVMVALQVQPDLRRPAEKTLQAKRGLCGNRAFALHDLVNAPSGDSNLFCYPVLRETEWLHEILSEDFARMNRK